MRKITMLVTLSTLSCVTYEAPSDELKNAPLGGQYIGATYLVYDNCSSRTPESHPEDFEPHDNFLYLLPQNKEQTVLNFYLDQLFVKDVMVKRLMIDGQRFRSQLKFEELFYNAPFLLFSEGSGLFENGQGNFYLNQGRYSGTPEARGNKVCEILFDIWLTKVVNYPYAGK